MNDAPELDLDSSDPSSEDYSITATEHTPVVIVSASDLSLTDVDSTHALRCQARITNDADGTDESISVTASLPPGMSQSYTASSHTLTLSAPAGTVTMAQFEQVLQSLTYLNDAENPSEFVREVDIFCFDDSNSDTHQSNTATAFVEVIGEDDAPQFNNGGFSTTFTEDEGPVIISSPTFDITDEDSNIASCVVILTNPLDGSAETLSGNSAGTTLSVTSTATQLTISGDQPDSAYTQVLNTVTYNNVDQDPDNSASRTITWVCTDVTDLTASTTSTITVIPVNDRPIVDSNGAQEGINNEVTFVEGTPVRITTPDATLSDIDDSNFVSCTATLEFGTTGGTETLSTSNQGGLLSVSFDDSTNVLSIDAASTSEPISVFVSALREIEYNYDSENPSTTDRQVSIICTDESGSVTADSLESIVVINIEPVNTPPVVDLNADTTPGSLDFTATPGWTEGNGPVVIVDPQTTVSDVDDTRIEFCTAQIISPSSGDSDEILSVTIAGTTASSSYDPLTSTLRVQRNQPNTIMQQIMRSLSYDSQSDNPSTEDRVVEVICYDGDLLASEPAYSTVPITASNDPPIIDLNGDAPGNGSGVRRSVFTEGDDELEIFPDTTTLSDPDSTDLSSCTASIVSDFDGALEFLSADTGTLPISASYSPATLTRSEEHTSELQSPA